METVNKVYHAASHAVWGDEPDKPGEEPVSGQTGQGIASDPYDAGNMEEQQTTEESTGRTTQDDINSQDKMFTPNEDSIDSKRAFERAPQRVAPDAPSNAAADSGLVGDPSSGTTSVPKQQGADNPLDNPTTDQIAHMQSKKSTAESIQDKPSGNEELASGGRVDTPETFPGEDTGSSNMKPSSSVSDQNKTAGGADLESTKSEAEAASGEKYYKSSGFAAEGGDFDATKPGAGREADRLLEHHGENIHPGETQANPVNEDAASGHDANANGNSHGKPKMVSRMKDKLHIGKHHDVKV